jgi:transposase
MAYSTDLREKVIAYLGKGHSMREAQEAFSIGLSTVSKWKQKYKLTGGLKRKRRVFAFKKLDPERLKSYVEKHPDAYLKEIGKVFGCSGVAVLKAFRRLGITRKKNHKVQRAKARAGR